MPQNDWTHNHEMVSMKSGLEGRNNIPLRCRGTPPPTCLNEIRPRRPEQSNDELAGRTRISKSQ